MKKIILFVFALALIGCQHTPTFTIEGKITHANGETLYLEHTGLVKTTALDSCVLDANGDFKLHAVAPEHPDFYRLRIASQSLPLAIDSTEIVAITASRDSLSHTLAIEGSDNSLAIAQLRATARTASREQLREHAKTIIVTNPRSLAAYYAVFLKQGGQYIWNIFDAADRRMYQAVATSFNVWMPNYERSKALYAQVSDIIKAEREIQQQAAMRQLINNAENTVLDISLTDDNGITQSLTDLRGKLIVLDFSAIEMEQSQGYIFELRELYNRYHNRGVTIYSVSLDRNKLLWEDGVVNLPWTNVYAGEQAIEVMTRYNVQSIPTLFLLDRKGNVQGRYTNFEQLDADIRKHL
jgi:glutathione peroxidase-family protein